MKPLKIIRKFFYVELAIIFGVICWGIYKTVSEGNIQKAIAVGLVSFMLWAILLVLGITEKDLSETKY